MIDTLLSPLAAISLFLTIVWTLTVHLAMGLGYRHIVRHWVVAVIGLTAGYLLAIRAGSGLPMLADVHLIEGSLGAIVVLVAAGLRAKQAPVAAGQAS